MIKLTRKQRNYWYKRALSFIESNYKKFDSVTCFCFGMEQVYNRNRKHNLLQRVFTLSTFPEYLKKKPEIPTFRWWSYLPKEQEHASRVKALKQCIRETR